MKEEVKTVSTPECLDQECDAMNKEMDVEPEAPYETPDETATEVPATPAKWSRSDTTDEKLEGSVQCLEPQWMVMRSARAKKTHHSTKVIITYQRRAGGDAVTNATGVAGFRSSCSADADARFVEVANF